jgi:hypothetical protein
MFRKIQFLFVFFVLGSTTACRSLVMFTASQAFVVPITISNEIKPAYQVVDFIRAFDECNHQLGKDAAYGQIIEVDPRGIQFTCPIDSYLRLRVRGYRMVSGKEYLVGSAENNFYLGGNGNNFWKITSIY